MTTRVVQECNECGREDIVGSVGDFHFCSRHEQIVLARATGGGLPTAEMLDVALDSVSIARVSRMADAFHPDQFTDSTGEPRSSHPNEIFDAAEAALLWACGRISLADFMSVFDGHDPGRPA